MRFAFLVHPLTEDTTRLVELSGDGGLRESFGWDLTRFLDDLHAAVSRAEPGSFPRRPTVRVIDELPDLVSLSGAHTEGRLYEIPMDSLAMLDDPGRAIDHMIEAVEMAADWGAKIVGLGSMTGIVGGHGTYLAERSPVAVTTGNSLTVYAAVENLVHACREVDLDLATETVAVVGIPGSIATAAARLLRPRCQSLLLVARRHSARTAAIADELDCELLDDIPRALARARVVLSATSSGGCIEQSWIRPGGLVSDVGVPTDVIGTRAMRDDCLILTGGLSRVPETMSLVSNYLWFHHGAIPSCLGETIVLALEESAECFSLGRSLDVGRIGEIGRSAVAHGIDFSNLYSFGLPLEESALVRFRKGIARAAILAPGSGPAHAPRREPAEVNIEGHAPAAATRYRRYINPMLATLGGRLLKTFVRGQGTRLWDAEGRSYLDFVAGYGSVNLGHNHPEVVAAVQSALKQGAIGFSPAAINPLAAALAEQLIAVTPPGLEIAFFCNSGTEAVEAAVKLARLASGRTALLHCERSFHGKTLGALSITGNRAYQRPFEPLVPDCHSVPFGDLEALERELRSRHFAAFVVEPIQGEGGMIVPPSGYLFAAQDLCRKAGTLLVVDEVQTGMGRTGSLLAVDRLGVEPDILTLAKSLGGGLVPIGAMLVRRDLWLRAYGSLQSYALHTTTFGGGSLACAAALAALRVLRETNVMANVQERSQQLVAGLREIAQRHPFLREIRGQGLMIGLRFDRLSPLILAQIQRLLLRDMSSHWVPGLEGMLQGLGATYVMSVLLQEHGIFTQVARSDPLVLRVQPPLVVNAQEIDEFVAAIQQCCEEIEVLAPTFDGIIAKSVLGMHETANRPRPTMEATT